MKYLSLFSGVGGFELGIQQAYEELQKLCVEDTKQSERTPLGDKEGQREQLPKLSDEGLFCIGFSEIDKYAIQVYKKHFKHKNYGDITSIDPKTLPDFNLLVGGFPCQAFSIAGQRRGFEDTRGTLFFEIARIIREKQPRLLLLENVKGLLSHDKGRTFYTIISTLDELGYDCQWQLLNSKNFGVPQNRERVFIVGHLRRTSRPEVFPLRGTHTSATFNNTIRTGGRGSLTKKHSWDIIQVNKPNHSNDRVYSEKGISPTLNTMQGGNRQPFIKGETIVRRLTPKECERLQGFPDDWTKYGIDEKGNEVEISDTQRYKMMGNAVTVNVIREIMKKIL